MKLSVEKFLVISGAGYLSLAVSYGLVYVANYDMPVDMEGVRLVKEITFLKLENAVKYDPGITWGASLFWGTMWLFTWAIWMEIKKENLRDFRKDEIIAFGVVPFLMASGLYFGLDYGNYFLLAITGMYAMVTVVLYIQKLE